MRKKEIGSRFKYSVGICAFKSNSKSPTKESNALSEVLIKKINDVNYVKESENSGTSGGSGSEKGCGSLLFSGSVLTGFAVVASVYVFGRKKR